jgi:hypothetical protein
MDFKPQPWLHVISFSGLASTMYCYSNSVGYRGDVVTTMFAILTCTAAITIDGLIARQDAWEKFMKQRAYAQPTLEETKAWELAMEKYVNNHPKTITGGNVNIALPVAENVVKVSKPKKEAPEEFQQYQKTEQLVTLAEVDNAVKKICRRNLTLVAHPDLGHPEGDFREDIWVDTKEMTRKVLNMALAVLEFNLGICRKGSAKNSSYIVADVEVLKLGARGPLPHPDDCKCEKCRRVSDPW